MALIKCPECGKEISDKAPNCIHCGYPLLNEDVVAPMPAEIDGQNKKVHCIQTKSKSLKTNSKLKVITGFVSKINPAARILISVVLVIGSLVCLVQGKNILNDGSYEFYKTHYKECMDGYENSLASAKTAGYLFKSSYESIAAKYKEMAEDDLAKIDSYRTKAITFYVSFAVLLLIAIAFICGVNIKKIFSSGIKAMTDDADSNIPPMIGGAITESNGHENVLSEKPSSDEPVQYAVLSDNESPSINAVAISDVVAEPDSYLSIENGIEFNGVEKVEQNPTGVSKYKKPTIIVGIVAAVLIVLSLGTNIFEKNYCAVEDCNREIDDDATYCSLHTCHQSDCSNKALEDGHYCYSHTCKLSGCYEKIATSYISNTNSYCSKHQQAYNSAVSTANLVVSNNKIEHNTSYTVFTATITNNGAATYKFVTVKGSFTSKNGAVLDTDSTYAIGSEGLAPGESTTFRMSIPKNRSVTNCTVSITDYDIASVNTSLIDFD